MASGQFFLLGGIGKERLLFRYRRTGITAFCSAQNDMHFDASLKNRTRTEAFSVRVRFLHLGSLRSRTIVKTGIMEDYNVACQ